MDNAGVELGDNMVPSFVPPPEIRRLRDVSRYRVDLQPRSTSRRSGSESTSAVGRTNCRPVTPTGCTLPTPRDGGARAVIEQVRVNPRKAPPMTFPGEILHQRYPSLPYLTWDTILDSARWGD